MQLPLQYLIPKVKASPAAAQEGGIKTSSTLVTVTKILHTSSNIIMKRWTGDSSTLLMYSSAAECDSSWNRYSTQLPFKKQASQENKSFD